MEDAKKDDGMEANGGVVPSPKGLCLSFSFLIGFVFFSYRVIKLLYFTFVDNDADNKCTSNVDSSSGKRRLSVAAAETTECDVKKAKLDLETVETTISSTNAADSVVIGNGESSPSKNQAVQPPASSVATPPASSTSNGKKSDERNDGDDLLERLDAIDASSLRKPDLKLDEIDSTDLEKDDLLKRLEEAENGLEGVSSSASATSVTAKKTENEAVCDSSADKIKPEKKNDAVVTITPSDEEKLLNDNEATNRRSLETVALMKTPEKISIVTESKPANNESSTDTSPAKVVDKDSHVMDVDKLAGSSTVNTSSATKERIVNLSKEPIKMDEDEYVAVPDSSKPTVVIPADKEKENKRSSNEVAVEVKTSIPNLTKTTTVAGGAKPTAPIPVDSKDVSHISTGSSNEVVGTSTETGPKVAVKVEETSTDDVTMADTTNTKSYIEAIGSGNRFILFSFFILLVNSYYFLFDCLDGHLPDKITQHTKKMKELNGIMSSSTDDKKSIETPTSTPSVEKPVETSSSAISSSDHIEPPKPSIYEVRLLVEKDNIKYLSVERIEPKPAEVQSDQTDSVDSTGGKSSLNGNLEPNSLADGPISSDSSTAATVNVVPASPIPADCITKSITGVTEMCNYMIDQFTDLRRKHEKLNPMEMSTPKSARGRGAEKKNLIKAEDESKSSGRKRGTPASKTSPTTKTEQFLVPATNSPSDHGKVGVIVLAKWVDRLYYAGKVTGCRPGNKFVVCFDDGKKKTLSHDAIVFGDEEVLPLIDQAVHAMVGNDEYETGLVTAYDIENGITTYTVICETMTVKVTSADIYLNDEQAKAIQNIYKDSPSDVSPTLEDSPADGKRPHRSSMARTEANIAAFTKASGGRGGSATKAKADPKTPEAGFSGGVVPGKRGGRRGRRPQQTQSESSDISDAMETDSMPNSPDSALEAIDGVQPELQKTPKESQINSSA